MANPSNTAGDICDQLRETIAHLEHLLPGQAPIGDFVHHNTLHGYQHLSFSEALAESERRTGARGYLTDQQFREQYRAGRISRQDLLRILDEDPELNAAQLVAELDGRVLKQLDVYLTTLLRPIEPVTASQLSWQLEEMGALLRFQADLPAVRRSQLLGAAEKEGVIGEGAAMEDLWGACLDGLGLTHYLQHPEELVDLSPEYAEQMLIELAEESEGGAGHGTMDRRVIKEADHLLSQLLEQVGQDLTLTGLLRAITGHDVLEELRPNLLRQVASYLDQGVAAWHGDYRGEGFYAAWRRTAAKDLNRVLEEMPDWYSHFESLPDDPMETIVTELRRLGLRQNKWAGYLQQLALELPGWSGMFLWRHLHPGYQGIAPERVEMLDYLAVRMVMEHLFAQRLCYELWQLEASLDMIRWHFRHYRAEFLVRYTLYSTRLPEYLVSLAQRLTEHSAQIGQGEDAWWQLAHMVSTWRQSPSADRPVGHSVYRSTWRLFRLAQHLGLCGSDIRRFDRQTLEQMLSCVDRLTPGRRGLLWLQAYELHYRDRLLHALRDNHGRQPGRPETASAQLVFCMDDREEGMRRHLEEVAPAVETFGAAAHFNVPNIWQALDERRVTLLSPVGVDPAHEISEEPRDGSERLGGERARRRARRFLLGDLLHQEIRRNLFSSTLLLALAAPAALLTLAGKLLAPLGFGRLARRLLQRYDLEVPTALRINALDDGHRPTPDQPRIGFTDDEQLDRLETLLRNIGLVERISPLVVIMAHGSDSQNNPHLAAYDCGACSGRHSGPNARIIAAIANRPEIRRRLGSERGIVIPEGTWFLGAEHNTCSEHIEWYDLQDLPDARQQVLADLRRSLVEAGQRHAQERCRRLASAPRSPTPERALRHVQGRALDFSQVRPELGHANNAAALIGRRGVSRGIFLDRRVFLISYDHTTDPSGEVLERLLLANAPVGAGISLEYYFSTVDNERYGCGSKVTHNLTGLFGVMDGAASDLRTGLPRQMVEIHEAMRLQVVIEASVATVAMIYRRQPALQQLIGQGWLLLSLLDPGSGQIDIFNPPGEFVPWQGGEVQALPRVSCSLDCYRGGSGPVAPALVVCGTGANDV